MGDMGGAASDGDEYVDADFEDVDEDDEESSS
jgi:molecular chaperone DnaK